MKDLYSIFFKYYLILVFILFLWLIHFINYYFVLNLHELGIFPRSLEGLIGIFFSPIIHSSSDHNHIINNSIPFLILGWALFFFYSPLLEVLFFLGFLLVFSLAFSKGSLSHSIKWCNL